MSYHSNSGGTGETPTTPTYTPPSTTPVTTPTTTSVSGLSNSSPSDAFTVPTQSFSVEPIVAPPAATEPPFKLPIKNIGYFQSTIPTTVPGWRAYNPYQGSEKNIPTGFDPLGWNCASCYFRLVNSGKNLCTKYRFEIPLGAWRCNSFVTNKAKFTPFVAEQTPFTNEEVLQLVDQQGRYLVDVFTLINTDPTSRYPFISGLHNKAADLQGAYVPVFVIGKFSYWSPPAFIPADRSSFLATSKFGSTLNGACIPMSLTEKPGYIQYDLDSVSNAFINLRFLPKPSQNLEFLATDSPVGYVGMMPKSVVDKFDLGQPLPYSYNLYWSFRFYYRMFSEIGIKIIFNSGDDLVSGRARLEAYGEKSVPVVIGTKTYAADKLEPLPVVRENIAVTPVSTGLLGIPREEVALNLFEDINKIGLDTTRWIAKTTYQYSSVEPEGWYDSYSNKDNPDNQIPEGALPYETALRVSSDIQNSGINLYCRVPPSTFPYHLYTAYGPAAYNDAAARWTESITFPLYGSPRSSGVTSSAELTSRQYFAYQPGRITGFTFGVRACPPEFVGSNSEVTWGIENDENAMFFRLNNGTWSIVRSRFNYFNPFTRRWSSYRTETVNQGSFNGDNLNGFGPSAYTMQWDKVTMFKIEYGWYGGVGARLYVYVPVGNKASKWVRVHDFGPPQSDSEPNTPADLKNKRYPTLSTPWFKVFYRIVSANGPVPDQGMLSLSKYGVSVYIDGGNPNSPMLTDVFGGVKSISGFNSQDRNLIIPNLMNFLGQSSVPANSVTVGLGNPSWGPAIQADPSNYEIVFNGGLIANITSASGTASPGAAWTFVGTWPANANGCPCTIQSKVSGTKISKSDVFPIIATRFKAKMRKRLNVTSISGGTTEITNYKVIVPKVLSVSTRKLAGSSSASSTPLKIDMWLSNTAGALTAPTVGKIFSYPFSYNYTLQNLYPDVNSPVTFFFKKNSNTPWWSFVPPVYLAPDWSQPETGNFNLAEESGNSPSRPDAVDSQRRRYLLGQPNANPSVYLRGGIVDGVSVEKDPKFFAMRLASAGSLVPSEDEFNAFRDPYFYNFNLAPDLAALSEVSGTLNFRHLDMVLMSDPIFSNYFSFSYEYTGQVYAGFYTHKPSVSTGVANTVAGSGNWGQMLAAELAAGMWPLYFTPYSLKSAENYTVESTAGRAYTNQPWNETKYNLDTTPFRLKYNTSFTRVTGATFRGGENRTNIINSDQAGVHIVFLMSPGSTIKNVSFTTSPGSNDSEQSPVTFLGQSDSKYRNLSSHTFLRKVYGKSLIGSGVQFPAFLPLETNYEWIKRLPTIENFSWGRPGIEVQVTGSSNELPPSFRDVSENSGLLTDTECTQKLSTSQFELLGSYFIGTPEATSASNPETQKTFRFDLSSFFSYNGTAIRGPGDYYFFVTAKNMSSGDQLEPPIEVAASIQFEEG